MLYLMREIFLSNISSIANLVRFFEVYQEILRSIPSVGVFKPNLFFFVSQIQCWALAHFSLPV
jgi:hypothetical protein